LSGAEYENVLVGNSKAEDCTKISFCWNNISSKVFILKIFLVQHTVANFITTDSCLLRIISVGFLITEQILTTFFAFIKYWKENGSRMRQYNSYS
jgi:hypothetical protein